MCMLTCFQWEFPPVCHFPFWILSSVTAVVACSVQLTHLFPVIQRYISTLIKQDTVHTTQCKPYTKCIHYYDYTVTSHCTICVVWKYSKLGMLLSEEKYIIFLWNKTACSCEDCVFVCTYCSIHMCLCVIRKVVGFGRLSDSIDSDRYMANYCSLGSAVLTSHQSAVKLD